MKKWLIAFAALALASCSSNNGKIYYQLPANTQPTHQVMSQGDRHLLWIDQITLTDFLSATGMVYQTSDVQYVIATNNLWASPLDQQLRNTLTANLSQALPGWIVASQPLGHEQSTLSVNVTGFHGHYDGKVIVSGEWLLKQQDEIITRPFRIELDQQADGYDAMVKTLAQAWQQEAQSIAAELIHRQ